MKWRQTYSHVWKVDARAYIKVTQTLLSSFFQENQNCLWIQRFSKKAENVNEIISIWKDVIETWWQQKRRLERMRNEADKMQISESENRIKSEKKSIFLTSTYLFELFGQSSSRQCSRLSKLPFEFLWKESNYHGMNRTFSGAGNIN